MADPASHVFDLLSERGVAKAALRRRFREDSCINSTRVLFDVYRAFGLAAEAVTVRARIYSSGFVNRAAREGHMPESPEEASSWTSEAGVWSVGIGYGGADMGRDKWPGHLVLRSDAHLIDATIDQANRPEHGIVMPPLLLLSHTPDAFWNAEELLEAEVNDCHVIYEPRPHDHSWMGSPAWSGRSHVEGAVATDLIRYLESRGVSSVPAAMRQIGDHIRQQTVSEAIHTLRQRIGWTQEELSAAIDKHPGRKGMAPMISRWERGIDRPSRYHRLALASIAARHGYEDLASVFGSAGRQQDEGQREGEDRTT